MKSICCQDKQRNGYCTMFGMVCPYMNRHQNDQKNCPHSEKGETMTFRDLVDGMTFEFTDEPGVKFKKIDGCEYQNVLTGVSMSLNYNSEFTVMNWEA